MRARRQVRVAAPVSPPETQAADGVDFVHSTRSQQQGGFLEETRTRRGNELTIERVTVRRISTSRGSEQSEKKSRRVVDANIRVAQILRNCATIADDSAECPWDSLDGYAHTLKDVTDTVGFEQNPTEANRKFWRNSRAWFQPRHFVGNRDHTSYGVFCQVDRNTDLYHWLRASGASKQVTEELLVVDRHRTLRQLRSWYVEGYEPHGGKCKMELDGTSYEDSCWGFWTEEEAQEFIDTELLGMIAWQLQQAGYVVPDLPLRDLDQQKRDHAKWRYKHNLHSFDWQDQ